MVPIPFDADKVKKTVDRFAQTVDAIKGHQFAHSPLSTLEEHNHDGRTFAHRVCRNCNVRFSDDNHRLYGGWRRLVTSNIY